MKKVFAVDLRSKWWDEFVELTSPGSSQPLVTDWMHAGAKSETGTRSLEYIEVDDFMIFMRGPEGSRGFVPREPDSWRSVTFRNVCVTRIVDVTYVEGRQGSTAVQFELVNTLQDVRGPELGFRLCEAARRSARNRGFPSKLDMGFDLGLVEGQGWCNG